MRTDAYRCVRMRTVHARKSVIIIVIEVHKPRKRKMAAITVRMEMSRSPGVPLGLRVSPNNAVSNRVGVALAAGLQIGDVITTVNGTKVGRSHGEAIRLMGEQPKDGKLVLEVRRKQQQVSGGKRKASTQKKRTAPIKKSKAVTATYDTSCIYCRTAQSSVNCPGCLEELKCKDCAWTSYTAPGIGFCDECTESGEDRCTTRHYGERQGARCEKKRTVSCYECKQVLVCTDCAADRTNPWWSQCDGDHGFCDDCKDDISFCECGFCSKCADENDGNCCKSHRMGNCGCGVRNRSGDPGSAVPWRRGGWDSSDDDW